jgi:tRNA(adenine34) deaminase
MSATGPSQGRVPRFEELAPVWRTCLEQAWEAFVNGSLPIGAAVVDAGDTVLAVGRNRIAESSEHAPHVPGTPYIAGSPLAHAEVNALLQLGYHRLEPRAQLFTTTEPCPLCMGASRMAGIGKVIYASRDAWAGAAVMAESVPYIQKMGPTVEGPIGELEEPLMTWLLAAHGDQQVRTASFIDRWRELQPVAAEVGMRLQATKALVAMAQSGVQAVWETIIKELAAARA